jgi:hypothetical protein
LPTETNPWWRQLVEPAKNAIVPGRVPWWETPGLSVKNTAEVLQCSNAKIYGLLDEGELEAMLVAGKTIVKTSSIIWKLERAKPWAPRTSRLEAANNARLNRRLSSGRPVHELGRPSSSITSSRATAGLVKSTRPQMKQREPKGRPGSRLVKETV